MKESSIRTPFIELTLSAIGIFLTFHIIIEGQSHLLQQNPIYLIIFITLCLLGSVATLFPRVCSAGRGEYSKISNSRFSHAFGVKVVHGHHIECIGFTNHEIRIGEKSVCAGCLGLLIGSLVAIFLTLIQAIHRMNVIPQIGLLGLVFVGTGLFHSVVIPGSDPIIRMMLNTFLVIGFALVYIVLSNVNGLGLLGIGSSIYWIYTRILLSKWSHEKICMTCNLLCIEKRGKN